MAQLLAALLLGAGWNAYVAVGTAPAYVAANDVSRTRCPALPDLADAESAPLEPPAGPQYCVHAWIVVLPTQREVNTGVLQPACMSPDIPVAASQVLLDAEIMNVYLAHCTFTLVQARYPP